VDFTLGPDCSSQALTSGFASHRAPPAQQLAAQLDSKRACATRSQPVQSGAAASSTSGDQSNSTSESHGRSPSAFQVATMQPLPVSDNLRTLQPEAAQEVMPGIPQDLEQVQPEPLQLLFDNAFVDRSSPYLPQTQMLPSNNNDLPALSTAPDTLPSGDYHDLGTRQVAFCYWAQEWKRLDDPCWVMCSMLAAQASTASNVTSAA